MQGSDAGVKAKKSKSAIKNLLLSSKGKGTGHENTASGAATEGAGALDTSKPSAVFKPQTGRPWTLSVALPGSIINNLKNPELKTQLAGRIARALAVFSVDEVIIFDDAPTEISDNVKPILQRLAKHRKESQSNIPKSDVLAEVRPDAEPWENPDQFLYHLLTYMETPPHLRTTLFPHHSNLKWAGALQSLDMPHHMKASEWCQYREGVTLLSPSSSYALVEAGLPYPVKIPLPSDEPIEPKMRVTVKFASARTPPKWPNLSKKDVETLKAELVHFIAPREEAGYYWGYTTRRASSLSSVYQETGFDGGYDFTIATSERGVPLRSILPESKQTFAEETVKLPDSFRHLLVIFGGVAGLEPAVVNDPIFGEQGFTKETASEAFDAWVNLVPGQGSRTIRTEEAVWIGLMGLNEYIEGHGAHWNEEG
ncbi:putative RNA methyltransferase [Lophiotrema nucula]|uniref:Putative RNA methyltransferase n=1 Tax=Lophiotrema nucula TaxID=690887 RepID=A0A6A5YRE4_9PLEO|nr:putative RNA methyltransferase [Lophiotrema nucula]